METSHKEYFSVANWVRFTFLGWLLGFILILVLSVGFDTIGIGNVQFFVGAGMGAGVGFMQWRMLKRIYIFDIKWFWYSTLGLTIPFLFFDLLNLFFGFKLGDFLIPVCTGSGALLAGLFQVRLLKIISTNANKWALSNFIGWAMATLVVLGMSFTNYLTSNNWVGFTLNILLILAGGVALGLVTGYFLKKILEID